MALPWTQGNRIKAFWRTHSSLQAVFTLEFAFDSPQIWKKSCSHGVLSSLAALDAIALALDAGLVNYPKSEGEGEDRPHVLVR